MQLPTFHQPAPVPHASLGKRERARIDAEVYRDAMHRSVPIAFDFRIDPEDDADSVRGKCQAASLANVHRFAAIERAALAVIRGAC